MTDIYIIVHVVKRNVSCVRNVGEEGGVLCYDVNQAIIKG